MKKLSIACVLILMLLALTACGNNGGDQESGPEKDLSSTPADATDTPENSSSPALPSETEPTDGSDTQRNTVLIAYFSCTGNTRTLAEYAADILNADLYEINPEVPYTSADLNYNDNSSRSSLEMNDSSSRPAISGSVESMEEYDTVFLGYPIWWGEAPRIISTFLESYDFSDKTIVPFCTSGSSGIGSSATNLHELCDNSANWLSGARLNSGASRNDVEEWIDSLALDIKAGDAAADTNSSAGSEENDVTNITLTIGDTVLTATMLDNPTARDFLTMLPLTLTFEDYNNTEKISYLPRELSTEDAPSGYEPSAGDITLYAPWGNLAIFYEDFRYGNGLIPLGHIDSGMETLSDMSGDFTVTIEIVN